MAACRAQNAQDDKITATPKSRPDSSQPSQIRLSKMKLERGKLGSDDTSGSMRWVCSISGSVASPVGLVMWFQEVERVRRRVPALAMPHEIVQ